LEAKYAPTLSIQWSVNQWSVKHDSEKGRRLRSKGGLPVTCPEGANVGAEISLIDQLEQEATRLIPLWLGSETHTRSVLKAISWRTLGTIDTFVISWFMTGRVQIAGSIAILEVGTKIVWYYFHERVWAAIDWGRRRRSEQHRDS
jgi:uncharacterized membrane protein